MAPKLGDLTLEERQVIQNITDGDVAEVNRLLADPNVRIECLDEQGMTLLQHAAYKANKEICEILLKRGADVNSNYHEHGYTALMFAALSGNKETTRLLLEAGANATVENNVNRTATQMAAFVGQHQVVSLINNFLPKDDLDYYTQPRGLEKEPKLPPHLCNALYKMILGSNLSPVKISFYLQQHLELLDETYKLCKLLDLLSEKMMKNRYTNEVMALKLHYLSSVMRQADKSRHDNNDKNLDSWIKRMVRGRPADGFPEEQEKLVRSILKDFPYSVESNLLQQIVRNIANNPIGHEPGALDYLNQGINGQRMASPEDLQCYTCNDFHAQKKCSACKMVNYCNQACQKLHWPTHKKQCKQLAERYKEIEIKKEEEARKAAEEEEAKKRREEELAALEADCEEEEKKDEGAKTSTEGGGDASELTEEEKMVKQRMDEMGLKEEYDNFPAEEEQKGTGAPGDSTSPVATETASASDVHLEE